MCGKVYAEIGLRLGGVGVLAVARGQEEGEKHHRRDGEYNSFIHHIQSFVLSFATIRWPTYQLQIYKKILTRLIF